jgi:hypothetical protein
MTDDLKNTPAFQELIQALEDAGEMEQAERLKSAVSRRTKGKDAT